MRVVFMGTPSFAVPSLCALADLHEVVGVFTQPDRVAGRGRTVRMSPVKEAALSLGLNVHQPQTLRDDACVALARELDPDVICVAAYGLILPRAVLDVPAHGCINVHASLLPRYRGAAPVHRAILAGEAITGVSIMLMEEGLDTGPVALDVAVQVDDHTVEELTTILAETGATALLEVLRSILEGSVAWAPQDDSLATYAAKVTREDVALDPGLRVQDALRRVRASTRSAPSRACIDGRMVTVVRASGSDHRLAPAAVLATKDALLLGVTDGTIALDEIRPEGKGCMDGACFARGAHLDRSVHWAAGR